MSLPEQPVAAAQVIVPVKRLPDAKTRMAGLLGTSGRRRLVLAMLDDTLRALLASPLVESALVVTSDEDATERAVQSGASTLSEQDALTALDPSRYVFGTAETATTQAATTRRGGTSQPRTDLLNRLLTGAAAFLRATGGDGGGAMNIAVVHADLPSLHSSEVTAALEAALTDAPRPPGPLEPHGTASGRSFVADREGTGTTALICKGIATALHPMFGPGSARRHAASGAAALPGYWPGLRTDVDTPAGLARAHRIGVGPATADVLATMDGSVVDLSRLA